MAGTLAMHEPAPSDAAWIVPAAATGTGSYRWTSSGYDMSPADVGELLSSGVAMQRIMLAAGKPAGIAQIGNLEPAASTANLEFLAVDSAPPLDALVALLGEFLTLAFDTLGLRKVTSSILATSVVSADIVAAIGGQLAGRLVGHERISDGVFTDLLIYELWPPSPSAPAVRP